MKKSLLVCLLFLSITLVIPRINLASSKLTNISSWAVFYGSKLPTNAPTYDLYIFSNTSHPDLQNLKSSGKKVVGYLNIGEIRQEDSLFGRARRDSLLIDKNQNWPGSFRIKIGSNKWHKLIIDEMLPEILSRGFEGVFLDTVDTAEYLEEEKKLSGQVSGAVELIKKIRNKFPNLIIILNNGLFLTDRVGSTIDALVVEDVYSLYDFKEKKYRLASQEWTQKRLIPLKAFQKKFKKPVLSLDYLEPFDKKSIKIVTNMAKTENFIPYIADINLQTLFYHP